MNNLTSIGQIIAQLIESIAVIDLTAVILQGSSTFKSIRGEGNTKKRISPDLHSGGDITLI